MDPSDVIMEEDPVAAEARRSEEREAEGAAREKVVEATRAEREGQALKEAGELVFGTTGVSL